MGRHRILGLLCFLFFLHSSVPFASSLCPPDQRDALLLFKNSFGDPNPYERTDLVCAPNVSEYTSLRRETGSSWDKRRDCCSWAGVTCDNVTGNVIGLDLPGSMLHGAFDSNCSLLLPKLEVLQLSSCNLTKFPYFLNSLRTLTYLDLSFNGISGEIPRWFWGIGRDTLKHLDLSNNLMEGGIQELHWMRLSSIFLQNNRFTGKVPFLICQLRLASVDLSGNNLYGNMPPCLGNITDLEYLNLRDNKFQGPLPIPPPSTSEYIAFNSGFTGEIPSSICQLSSLHSLDLSNNNLYGYMPPCFGNMTNLGYLDLSSNKLQGPLWRSQVKWPNLLSLDLSGNEFSDVFPDWLEAPLLMKLDLQSNKFHGSVNLTAFGPSFPALAILYISNNYFTEWWPTEVSSNISLVVMDLSNNKFGGPIPLPSPIVTFYSVARNEVTGKIPPLICNATKLEIIDLSNNGLIGSLPRCLTNFSTTMSILNFRRNHLEGTIPQSFSSSLMTLDLSQNQIEGTLPRSLVKCQYLEVLDLGDNKIEDTFPRWLGTLLELKVLILRSNKFKDLLNIPRGAKLFPKLHILDISNNNFGGPLPTNLMVNFKGMMNGENGQDKSLYMTRSLKMGEYENSVTVKIKGITIELVKILTVFTTIDLSNNSFYGDIPEVCGHLHSLIGLSLSHNRLTGSIPLTLGNLTNLEWLDLSSNMLSGGIPRVLGDLTFLGYLDLSKNQLTGRIPQDKHLSTFSSDSFSGNPNLCGTPLPKACLGDARPPPLLCSSTFDYKGHESWFNQKVVWIGYASGIVIGISIAYIAFEIGRPKWLVRGVKMLERRAAKWMEKPKRKAITFHGQ